MQIFQCFSLLFFVVGQAKDPVCQGGACRKGSTNYLLQQRQHLNKSTSIAAQHLASQANVSQRGGSSIAKAGKEKVNTIRTMANQTRGSTIKATVSQTHGSRSAKAIDAARARVGRAFRSKQAIKKAKSAGTRADRKFKSEKTNAGSIRSTASDDTYILHLVETCDAAASSCTGGLTVYADTSQSSKIGSTRTQGGYLNCANWDHGGIDRRRGGSGRRRRRRLETCQMKSFQVDAGCQMTMSLDGVVSAFYGPGTYKACPCPQFLTDTKATAEYLLKVAKHEALCDAAAEEPNLALLYETGADVSEWGTDCVSDYPVVMKDSSTGLYYVLENASDPCFMDPSDALPSTTVLTADGKGTCSDIGTTGGICLDVAAAVTGYASLFQTSDDTLAVMTDIAIPMVTLLLNSVGANDALIFNFCFGKWSGSELAGAAASSSLYADNCHYPPYVGTNSYNVIAMQIPVSLLNAYGLCSDEDLTEGANFCVAYTQCSKGQPTFAMMIDGTAAGCLAGGSSLISAVTGGLSQVFSKAIANTVETIGWGLSLTGEFQKTFTIWNGDFEDVTINGNVFNVVGIDLSNMLSKKTKKYMSASGTFYDILQVGDGSMTDTVKDLFSSDTPMDVIEVLTKQSHYGSFSISLYVLFSDLTNGMLTDLYLGDALTINGLVSTQSMSGLEPGMYLYMQAGQMNLFSAIMSWFCTSFAGILFKIGGAGLADKLTDLFSDTSSGSSGQLGVFLNTDSFGFITEVPASTVITGLAIPGFDLGTITIECTMKLLTIGMVCSIGYDAPNWVGALWKAISGAYNLVVGAVATSALKAWESAADAIGGIDWIEQWGNLADAASDVAALARGALLDSAYYKFYSNAVINPEDTFNDAIDAVADQLASAYSSVSDFSDDVGSAVTDVFSGRRRRRWFGNRRRRRKSIFR